MSRSISLASYVKRRNGVPLGAAGSMGNMLRRSLGAPSFAGFWQYWNPVWGYYLSRYVMRPLSVYLPVWAATMLTFAISGALHDLIVALLKWKPIFFITPWFVIMGAMVVISTKLGVSCKQYSWLIRALINVSYITLSLALVFLIDSFGAD